MEQITTSMRLKHNARTYLAARVTIQTREGHSAGTDLYQGATGSVKGTTAQVMMRRQDF